MAAAEGTVGTIDPEALGARLGLSSWLFLRDLVGLELVTVPGLSGGRMGEVSRDGFGEVAADVVVDVRGVVDVRFRGRDEDEEDERCGCAMPVLSALASAPLLLLVLLTASFASGWLATPVL